jgi:hypothetical protein
MGKLNARLARHRSARASRASSPTSLRVQYHLCVRESDEPAAISKEAKSSGSHRTNSAVWTLEKAEDFRTCADLLSLRGLPALCGYFSLATTALQWRSELTEHRAGRPALIARLVRAQLPTREMSSPVRPQSEAKRSIRENPHAQICKDLLGQPVDELRKRDQEDAFQ